MEAWFLLLLTCVVSVLLLMEEWGVLRTVSLSQLYKMVSHLAMILLLEECL